MKLIEGIEFFSAKLGETYSCKFDFKDNTYKEIFKDLCKDLDIDGDLRWYSSSDVGFEHVPQYYNPNRSNKNEERDFFGKVFCNLFLDRIKELSEDCEFDMVLDDPFEVYVYMEICDSVICNEELEGKLHVKLKSVTSEPESGESLFKAVISLKGSKYFIGRINRQWEELNVEYLKEHVSSDISDML